MKKPLSHFRHMERQTIANLDGMKSIMRVEHPRKREWWLVLPAIGDSDAVCVLLHKESVKKEFRGGAYEQSFISGTENQILAEYANRIVKS